MKNSIPLISTQASASLRLQADITVVGSITDFTYRWATNNGLPEEDSLRLSLSVDELVTDIVRFAYPQQPEPGEFEIHFLRRPAHIEIKIHEWGEPFDPDRHLYDLNKAITTHNFEGAGFRLIHFMTDEFSFINRGSEGKIYRLVKYLNMAESRSLPMEEPADEKTALGNIEFTIQSITTQSAEDVARLIYRCYGNSYPKEEMYHPKYIEQAVVRKKKIGVIAYTPDREPAGYFAVLDTTDSNIGEVGEAVVARPYRQRGLFKKMMYALIINARKSDLLGIYGKAIAVHEFSQRVNCQYGFATTAIILADFPSVKLHGISDNFPEPVSEVVDFLLLKPLQKRAVTLPDPYQHILAECYRGIEVDIKQTAKVLQIFSKTKIDTEINFKEKKALLVISRFGSDFEKKLNLKLNQLFRHNLNVIYLDIPLMQGDIQNVVKKAQQLNFIFAGLLPLFHKEQDYLRMQQLLHKLDLNKVITYSVTSQKIKQILHRELNEIRNRS